MANPTTTPFTVFVYAGYTLALALTPYNWILLVVVTCVESLLVCLGLILQVHGWENKGY